MKSNQEWCLARYREMVRLQALEKALTALSRSGNLRGSLHLATGQEAVPSGACAALKQDDALSVTYRGHGYILAKGCDFYRVVAEILGKQDGLCKGKGGKMHLTDIENGLLGANGIVGGGIGMAVGAALASHMDSSGKVALTVFGDGTLNQGHSHEAFNIAGLMKLPVIFLCENNLYAEMTPLDRSSANIEPWTRMSAYGIPAVKIDGNDVFAVYDAMTEAVERGRSGGGATFIEAMTYRTCGHYQNDPGTAYRTKEEIAEWEAQSPILRLEAHLKAQFGLTETQLEAIVEDEASVVAEVLHRAQASPDPLASALMEDLYV